MVSLNPSGIKPVAGNIVVRVEMGETEKRLAAMGLHASDQTKERDHHASMTGEVLAIADDIKWGIGVGHRVLFGRYAGTMVKGADGEDYRLVVDDDVKGIYHGD